MLAIVRIFSELCKFILFRVMLDISIMRWLDILQIDMYLSRWIMFGWIIGWLRMICWRMFGWRKFGWICWVLVQSSVCGGTCTNTYAKVWRVANSHNLQVREYALRSIRIHTFNEGLFFPDIGWDNYKTMHSISAWICIEHDTNSRTCVNLYFSCIGRDLYEFTHPRRVWICITFNINPRT